MSLPSRCLRQTYAFRHLWAERAFGRRSNCRNFSSLNQPKRRSYSGRPGFQQDQNALGVFTPTAAGLFILTGIGLYYYFRMEKQKLVEKREQERASRSYGKPNIGGPFSLARHTGDPFSELDLLGKWNLVYFGFTNCPDICPAELDKISAALDGLEKNHGKIFQPIFVSVDPARDTPSSMARYLSEFHPAFIGLVGSYDATQAVCKKYRVYFSTPPDADPKGDYIVDHSIFVYLMDPQGKFVDAFGQVVTKEEMQEKIGDAVSQWKAEKGSIT